MKPDDGKKQDDERAGLSERAGDLFASLAKLAQEVNKEPGAAVIAVGLIVVLAAFVSKIGSIEIVGRASTLPTAAVGLVMIGVGYRWHRRATNEIQGDYDPIVLDRTFMLKVFQEAMPPAFIKREPPDGQIPETGLKHIFESQALREVEDATDDISSSSPRFKQIVADHIAGDKAALAQHRSYSLEFASYLASGQETPILTFKTRIQHEGSRYIVGWYIPVQLDKYPDGDSLLLEEETRRLIKFRLARAQGKGGCKVKVGDAFKSGVPGRG
jgi:hypothetical protein